MAEWTRQIRMDEARPATTVASMRKVIGDSTGLSGKKLDSYMIRKGYFVKVNGEIKIATKINRRKSRHETRQRLIKEGKLKAVERTEEE